jgi:AraC-like DNA-binding protein
MRRINRLRPSSVFTDSTFPLRVIRVPAHRAMCALHAHGFEELVVIVGGRARHQVGREVYDIGAGDVFVILGGMAHCYPEARELSLINLLYDSSALRLPRADLGALPGYQSLFRVEPRVRSRQRFKNQLRLSVEDLGRLLNRVAELEAELKRRAPGYRFMATMHFMDIVGFLSRAYGRTATPEEPRPVSAISRALSHIEEHYAEPIRVEDLCRVAHLSTSSLFRAFREIVGRPPMEHVIRLRVDKAAQLLRGGGRRIGEAGDDAGFADSNYFSRQFRRVMGVSPREYRRQYARGPAGGKATG